MKKIFTLFFLALLAASAHSQTTIYLKGILQGAQQVPANASTASGVVIVNYDPASNILNLTGNYEGLTATINASHIHGPAPAGSNASVLFPLNFTGGTTGTLSGTDTLTEEQEADLINGQMYVNVHNANYPGGEIRAQLTTTSAETNYFTGRLQGAQQVPPNNSPGTGSVMVLLDRVTDSVFLTGSFSGLTAPASASHIHNGGLPGVNGPVFQDLVFSADVMGTLHVAAPISKDNETQMVNGMTYVNIHNANYPGGEIRGQLTKYSQLRYLKAILQGSQQVPPNSSVGMGTVIVKYRMDTRAIELIGDYQNISADISASHIHSPAPVGATAPVLIPLTNTGGTSGTLTGSATLTGAQESDLLNGLMYVNVHDANYPDGEIRGQLTATAGETEYFTGNLQGAQEVPANASTAIGNVTVLLDRVASTVYATGSFAGLGASAQAGHIHRGPAGISGPVIVPLSVTAATSGTITGSGVVTTSFADSMIQGYSYVNVHTAIYPAGEIRGQLGNLVLPVKLSYFNGYKTGNSITLIWETTSEVNLRSFEVEQQNAAGAWIQKATVAAKGGSSAANYTITDVPSAGKNGTVLYRLKMVDANGRFTYSPVINIGFLQSKARLSIVPNPVTNGVLLFTITGLPTNQQVTARIIDFNGKTLATATVATVQNNRLYISQLPAGLYKLAVNINGNLLQKTFSKQ